MRPPAPPGRPGSTGRSGWVPFALVALVVVPAVWMTRAYALALGAGTQVFTQGIGKALFGTSERNTDLCLGRAGSSTAPLPSTSSRLSVRRRAIIGRPTINSGSLRATAKVGSS
jgi:hypothetical protein